MNAETFKLEPVTKDTILCDQKVLREIKEWILETELYDYESMLPEYGTLEECPFSAAQWADCLPYVEEWFSHCLQVHDRISHYLNYDLPDQMTDDAKHDDRISDVGACCYESFETGDLEIAARKYLLETYPGLYQRNVQRVIDLVSNAEEWFSDNFESCIDEGYYARADKNFITFYSWGTGEEETTISIENLKDALEAPNCPEDILLYFLDKQDIEVRSGEFNFRSSTDVTYFFGTTEESLESYLEEQLSDEDRDIKTIVTGANGKPCEETTGSCSCCGFDRSRKGDENCEFRVYRAQWADSDGVFYSRLCGTLGWTGCIYEVEPATGGIGALCDIVNELSGDDSDGAESTFEDFKAMGAVEDLEE